MSVLSRLFVVIVLSIGLFVPMYSGRVSAAGAAGSWQCWDDGVNPNPCRRPINALKMISANDGWAAGDGGILLHWNGVKWSKVSSPTTNALQSLDEVSSTNIWAVGAEGTILHWNGSTWSAVTSPTSNQLTSVSMAAADEGWSVGANQTLLHWNGTDWQSVTSPVSDNLAAVSMASKTDGWIVGNGGLLLRYNGSAWQKDASSDASLGNLYSVDMASTSEGWAVGGSNAVRWHNNSWSVTSPGTESVLYSVDAVSANSAYAVDDDGILFFWNGSSWSSLVHSTDLVGSILHYYTVSSIGGSQVFYGGWSGLILQWDGTHLIDTNQSTTLGSIQMLSANHGWAVGNDGAIRQWNGIQWLSVSSPTSLVLNSLYMVTPEDGWAVGASGTILHWNGSKWSGVSSPVSVDLADIWMVGENDGWIVGSNGTILRWKDHLWTVIPNSDPNELYAVAMRNSQDGWIVGDGIALHWDGQNWNKVPVDPMFPPPGPDIKPTLETLAITPGGDAYATRGFSPSEVWKWNGASWGMYSTLTSNSFFFNPASMVLIADDDGWMVGGWHSSSTIQHWNGTSWTETANPTQSFLNGVSMASAAEGWAVGWTGVILHYSVPSTTSNITQADGGTVTSPDGATQIVFPAGAVPRDTDLTYTNQTRPNHNVAGFRFAGVSFTLESNPEVSVLSQPAVATLHYLDADVFSMDENNLRLYQWDKTTQSWKDAAESCSPASTYTRDASSNQLSLVICHMSEFAVMTKDSQAVYLPLVVR